MRFLIVFAAACGSSTPATQPPIATPLDAAIDAPEAVRTTIDAGLPADVTSAPPWIFRYNAPGRLETWTLRYHGGVAAMDVESATGTLHYIGTAAETTSLALVLTAGSARLSLDCKHEQRAIGAACGDKRQPKQDVLACYHPDFKEPMPFAPAPGVEYLSSAACTGYHRL